MCEPALLPLTQIAPQTWQQDFPQALVSPDFAVRKQAFADLLKTASRETIPVLVEMLKHEKDPDLASQAKALLLQLSNPATADSPRDPYGIFRI